MIEGEAQFCIRCGSPLDKKNVFGRLRPVCSQCGWVLFPDPKVAVAAIAELDHKILLVRRTNEPSKGKWSLPAGFMDAGETPDSAIVRECFEETGLHVHVKKFHKLISGKTHPNGSDLLLIYLVEVVSGKLEAGDDADEAKFFALHQLPPLAFENMNDLIDELS